MANNLYVIKFPLRLLSVWRTTKIPKGIQSSKRFSTLKAQVLNFFKATTHVHVERLSKVEIYKCEVLWTMYRSVFCHNRNLYTSWREINSWILYWQLYAVTALLHEHRNNNGILPVCKTSRSLSQEIIPAFRSIDF